jgi:hypothetical protein
MDKMVAAEMMVTTINQIAPFAKARLWTAKDDKGNVTKIRVYCDKGYVEVRDDCKAYMETVGRNYFDAAKAALAATGYERVYA